MKLPEHSWAFRGDAIDEALRYRISRVTAPAGVSFDSESFIQKLINDPRTYDLTHDDICSAFSHAVEQHTKISRPLEGHAEVASLAAARSAKKGGFNLNNITVDQLLDSHAAVGSPKRPTGSKMIDVGTFSKFTTEQKVYGGMSLLMAAMCTVGAARSFSHATANDADGKSHVQWSNVSLGLLNAAFAIGSAYALHQQFKVR